MTNPTIPYGTMNAGDFRMKQAMSEAPERIYAKFATTGPGINIRKWSTSGFPEAEAEYLLADTAIPRAEADAMICACSEGLGSNIAAAIRAPAKEPSE